MEDLSPKMRAYLAELYRLADANPDAKGYISTSALADVLNVSPPAVNRMVNRLKEMGYILHEPYQGIKLTSEGMREALLQIRIQRITETFLMKVMGLEWEDVTQEAETLVGAISSPLLQRMYEMSDNPTLTPHGEPIPNENGEIEALTDIPLSDAPVGEEVRITRLRTRETERLSYIQALGLVPDTTLDVVHKAPFDGPMQLKINKEYRIIGHNLAELIHVVVMPK